MNSNLGVGIGKASLPSIATLLLTLRAGADQVCESCSILSASAAEVRHPLAEDDGATATCNTFRRRGSVHLPSKWFECGSPCHYGVCTCLPRTWCPVFTLTLIDDLFHVCFHIYLAEASPLHVVSRIRNSPLKILTSASTDIHSDQAFATEDPHFRSLEAGFPIEDQYVRASTLGFPLDNATSIPSHQPAPVKIFTFAQAWIPLSFCKAAPMVLSLPSS